jgi:ketosteroid isomerase-like protein
LPVIDGHSDIEEIQIVGDTAYVRTRLAVTVTSPQGETNRRAGYTLSVLRKSQGRWQIARDANLLTPAKD